MSFAQLHKTSFECKPVSHVFKDFPTLLTLLFPSLKHILFTRSNAELVDTKTPVIRISPGLLLLLLLNIYILSKHTTL